MFLDPSKFGADNTFFEEMVLDTEFLLIIVETVHVLHHTLSVDIKRDPFIHLSKYSSYIFVY